ncbi:MAG: roadblock/LC7 domain-containing protein [Dactylosporangium sp.]|nr:roadblock/LC7 domain-containing protein [Dactylosporangium sp.]NNJ60445.1 roadblock/LC7 domain-containing protein [Dactylosporangium sp.]
MREMDWLLNDFVEQVHGVAHVVVVSVDGLLLSASRDLPGERAEQFSAIAAGLVSLASGAARHFDGGTIQQTIVDMEAGYLILMSISDGSSLVVLASRNCDVGQIGYEMALLVDRVGKALAIKRRQAVASGVER